MRGRVHDDVGAREGAFERGRVAEVAADALDLEAVERAAVGAHEGAHAVAALEQRADQHAAQVPRGARDRRNHPAVPQGSGTRTVNPGAAQGEASAVEVPAASFDTAWTVRVESVGRHEAREPTHVGHVRRPDRRHLRPAAADLEDHARLRRDRVPPRGSALRMGVRPAVRRVREHPAGGGGRLAVIGLRSGQSVLVDPARRARAGSRRALRALVRDRSGGGRGARQGRRRPGDRRPGRPAGRRPARRPAGPPGPRLCRGPAGGRGRLCHRRGDRHGDHRRVRRGRRHHGAHHRAGSPGVSRRHRRLDRGCGSGSPSPWRRW